MSARRRSGDVVFKIEGAGFGGPGGLVELVGEPDGCPLGCGDPECQEWPDARFVDGSGWARHVSECELGERPGP